MRETIREKGKKRMLAIVAIALVAFMLGQTFAFWTQEVRVKNEYKLGKHSTKIVEEFDAPTNWMPGQDITKEVTVLNEGSFPVFVKTQLNLKWLGNNPNTGEAYGLTFLSEQPDIEEYAALISFGEDVVLLASGESSVPSLSLSLPTVETIQEANGKWLLLQETPDSEGNLTFFYIGSLATDESTPLLIDRVKMNAKIEASTTATLTVYDKANQEWVTTTTANPTSSYEGAKFLLTVNAYTVQASVDAVKEIFASDTLSEQNVVAHLTSFGIDAGNHGINLADTNTTNNRNSRAVNALTDNATDGTTNSANNTSAQVISAEPKTLHFEEVGGTLTFTPIKSNGDEQWFMSFLNMLPGVVHTDSINIENRTNKGQNLYMQVLPIESQADHLDEILELINMKVYHGDELIYDGTALGKDYVDSKQSLHEVIALGEYQAKSTNNIKVELELDKNVDIERAEHLTEIDWRFMAVEVTDPDEPVVTATPAVTTSPTVTTTPNNNQAGNYMPPKTGDDNQLARYLVMMAVAALGLGVCIYLMKKKSKEEQGLS